MEPVVTVGIVGELGVFVTLNEAVPHPVVEHVDFAVVTLAKPQSESGMVCACAAE
jgi:hypothetical protein